MYSRNQTLINLINYCDKNRQTIMSYDLEKQIAVIRSQIGETSGLIVLKGDELKRIGENNEINYLFSYNIYYFNS